MKTTIQKWGNSYAVRLPKIILDSFDWNNEKIEVENIDNTIVIRKIEKPKRKNIKELFENFNGEYHPIDVNWGKPQGKEVW